MGGCEDKNWGRREKEQGLLVQESKVPNMYMQSPEIHH